VHLARQNVILLATGIVPISRSRLPPARRRSVTCGSRRSTA
jgi:hypothetical protein